MAIILVNEELLSHMSETDMGDVSLSALPAPHGEMWYVFGTPFGNIEFRKGAARYESRDFTGNAAQKIAVYRIFCDVCSSFEQFPNACTPVGFSVD